MLGVDENQIFITKPILPELSDFQYHLDDLWTSKYLTNMGVKHNELEAKLKRVLKVPNVSLFNNGTIALLTAIKLLNLPANSEVITTPFTFAATPHCIIWNNLKPVFCDIEQNTMTIDANKIEALITPNTSAILGVHVYGFPCDVKKIDNIAKKYNLKVIYDAAHAFSTEIDGKGIGEFGDITMFSFHSTKLFHTIEGGCLTCSDNCLAHKINNLRNFGIMSEDVVEDIGINGKLDEFRAAIGLENLKIFDIEKAKRSKVKQYYDRELSLVDGIKIPKLPKFATNSYQYYPILIEENYGITRDELYNQFKELNIHSRKYFYPACHDYDCYKNNPDVICGDLEVVNDIKNKVLCLPYYGDLPVSIKKKICEVVKCHQKL